MPLPRKLAERVKQVNQQFDYDVMQRWGNTVNNHQSKLNTIAAKGKIASERVAQAKQRRLLMKGDDMHFTVTTATTTVRTTRVMTPLYDADTDRASSRVRI